MGYSDNGILVRDVKNRRKSWIRKDYRVRNNIVKWTIAAVVMATTMGLFLLAGR